MDRYTDKTFSQLESHISKMYKEAQKDLRKKLEDFTRHHRTKDAEMQRKLKAGEITQAQYQQWITGQVFIGNQWKQKIEQVNNSIKGVMQNASNLTHGKSMDVFAENANYTAYQLEKDLNASINFGLYDTATVSRLVGKDPEILPRRVVNGKKLEAWETKKISNAISQGIIQGEGIDQIADRIARDTCIAADKSSVMYARTAMTCAQNAGMMERLHEAKDMGIKVKKRWMAVLDDRTRDSHADLDGQTVDIDEDFTTHNRNGSIATLSHPGDPSAPFEQICNCRCTMVYVYPEFQQSFERSASLGYDEKGHKQYETVKDMTYREWQKSKQPTEPKSIYRSIEPATTKVISAEQFVPALSKAKESCPVDKAWRVDTSRTAEDFKNDRITTYVTPGGSTFALKDDGDIISVCKNQLDDSGTNARSLLAAAVEAGGTHLDSFDGNYGFYVRCGFEPVSRCKFDEEYAPPGWMKGRDQPEDIYFMRYVGIGKVKYATIDEARASIPYSAGYDEAEKVVKEIVRGDRP